MGFGFSGVLDYWGLVYCTHLYVLWQNEVPKWSPKTTFKAEEVKQKLQEVFSASSLRDFTTQSHCPSATQPVKSFSVCFNILSPHLNPWTTDDTFWHPLTLAACYWLAQSILKMGFVQPKRWDRGRWVGFSTQTRDIALCFGDTFILLWGFVLIQILSESHVTYICGSPV